VQSPRKFRSRAARFDISHDFASFSRFFRNLLLIQGFPPFFRRFEQPAAMACHSIQPGQSASDTAGDSNADN
jgi:hypothetical protein